MANPFRVHWTAPWRFPTWHLSVIFCPSITVWFCGVSMKNWPGCDAPIRPANTNLKQDCNYRRSLDNEWVVCWNAVLWHALNQTSAKIKNDSWQYNTITEAQHFLLHLPLCTGAVFQFFLGLVFRTPSSDWKNYKYAYRKLAIRWNKLFYKNTILSFNQCV